MKTIVPFNVWSAEQMKILYPYSKTVRIVEKYFATAWDDDILIEFSRKDRDGYSNSHFTNESLKNYYKAKSVKILKDYSLEIEY